MEALQCSLCPAGTHLLTGRITDSLGTFTETTAVTVTVLTALESWSWTSARGR